MTSFGLLLSTEYWSKMEKEAQLSEELGFHSIWIDDHLLYFNHKNPESRIEAWTGLTSLANKTSKIRLGNLVLCNSFRNPGLLGKMVASLDNISKGRLEFGIGAGWYKEEYDAYGMEFLSTANRIDQLRETLEILNNMFTGEKFDYAGNYWNLKGCLSLPKPIQHPMPIWIGAKKPKMISLAVKYATGINITTSTHDEFEKIINIITKACDDVGKKVSELKISYMTFVHITKDMYEREKVIDYLHDTWYPQPPREAFETLLVGPTELIKDKLSFYVDNFDLDIFIANCKGSDSINNPFEIFKNEICSDYE